MWPTAAAALAECVETFQKYMHLPDAGSVYVAIATPVANRMGGDPLWSLLVGPPSSGKTEPIRAVARSEVDCHMIGTITEAGLLSATPKKQRTDGARGGLLREIGEFGILVAKDFTSVLSMHRDARTALLAALREIYDGAWTRIAGSDGGKRYEWAGKLGFLGGVTGAIDSAHAVMGMMGERFLLYRLPEQTAADQARAALRRSGDAQAMRAAGEPTAPRALLLMRCLSFRYYSNSAAPPRP
jgi:hypothetical protein